MDKMDELHFMDSYALTSVFFTSYLEKFLPSVIKPTVYSREKGVY